MRNQCVLKDRDGYLGLVKALSFALAPKKCEAFLCAVQRFFACNLLEYCTSSPNFNWVIMKWVNPIHTSSWNKQCMRRPKGGLLPWAKWQTRAITGVFFAPVNAVPWRQRFMPWGIGSKNDCVEHTILIMEMQNSTKSETPLWRIILVLPKLFTIVVLSQFHQISSGTVLGNSVLHILARSCSRMTATDIFARPCPTERFCLGPLPWSEFYAL